MNSFPEMLAHCVGFQWDEGNADKNWKLHHVSRAEAEETFFNRPLVVASGNKHSEKEIRVAALERPTLTAYSRSFLRFEKIW